MIRSNCHQLFWLDLEMTGFDPVNDLITELAVVITDMEFKVLAEYQTGVFNQRLALDKRLKDNPWFKEQSFSYQQKIYDLSKDGQKLIDIEADLISLLDKYTTDKLVVLAGNSIHMDRKFIDQKLPEFAARLHYRMLDVSSFKIYLENVLNFSFEKKQAHRALDDVYESIEEFKFYLKKLNI